MGTALLWARVFFVTLLVFVTVVTLIPNPDDTAGFAAARFISSLLFGDDKFADKVAHVSAYGALGASAYWAQLIVYGKKRWTPLLLAAYGALLEGVQGIGGVRDPELADGIANAAGALIGFSGAWLLYKFVLSKWRR